MSDGPFYYVRSTGSRVAHHWDYRRDRSTHALCGHPYGEILYEGPVRPRAVCSDCQAAAAPYELRFYRARAKDLETELEAATAELVDVRRSRDENRESLRRLQAQLRQLQSAHERLKSRTKASAATGSTKRGSKGAASPRKRRAGVADAPYKVPRIRVVSGGAPGLGKRR